MQTLKEKSDQVDMVSSWLKGLKRFHWYSSDTSREIYLGSTRSNETPLAGLDIFQRRVLKLRTINQAHIHKINDPSGDQRNPRFIFRSHDAV